MILNNNMQSLMTIYSLTKALSNKSTINTGLEYDYHVRFLKSFFRYILKVSYVDGGEGGIRTHGPA